MARVDYLPEAEAEVVAAQHWYADRSETAGIEFAVAVSRGIEQIAAHPESWERRDSRHGAYLLDNFPYSLVYRSQGDLILIVAVAHASRKPGYWRGRK